MLIDCYQVTVKDLSFECEIDLTSEHYLCVRPNESVDDRVKQCFDGVLLQNGYRTYLAKTIEVEDE